MQVATNHFIQAIEVWRPSPEKDRYLLAASAFGDLAELGSLRRNQEFEDAQGLVGRTAERGIPIIASVDDLAYADEFAAFEGTHVVGFPVMKTGNCHGVVVFYCDEGEDWQAAFETWRPNDRGELSLFESWHPHLERFGLISQYVNFPRRAGLPGRVWADRFPRVMGALGQSKEFVRVASAKAEGLATAIGIPLMHGAFDLDAVFVMLSAAKSPLAHVMEIWALDPETGQLKVVSADYGSFVDLAPMSRHLQLRIGEGIAGRAFQDQAPWATWDLMGVEFRRGEKFASYGFEWGVGIPVFVGDNLFAVAVLIR